MKPKNFPARKQQRRAAAAMRANGHKRVCADDMPVQPALRAVRTKKDRRSKAKVRAA